MTADTLSDTQRNFLKKHLYSGIAGLFMGKENKQIEADYKTYVAADKTLGDELVGIPVEYTEVGELQTVRTTAANTAKDSKATEKAGGFAQLSRTLTDATNQAKSLRASIVESKQKTLSKLDGFTDPGNADGDDTQGLAALRLKVTTALAADLPKPAQIDAAVIELSELERGVMAVTMMGPDDQKWGTLVGEIPAENSEMATLVQERATIAGDRRAGKFGTAVTAMYGLVTKAETLKTKIADARKDVLDRRDGLADPTGADVADKKATGLIRARITAAMKDPLPKPAEFDAAEKALAELDRELKTIGKLAALRAKNPKAAKAAREALDGFSAEIGDLEITDKVFEDAGTALTAANTEFVIANNERNAANNLPQNSPQEIAARNEAIRLATEKFNTKKSALDAATKHTNAITGKKLLNEAIAFGPLSPTAPRPLADGDAEAMAKAYGKNPRVADAAVQSLKSAKDPSKVAQAVGPVCDMAASGFATSGGTYMPNPAWADDYAQKIITCGAQVGGSYFDGLPAYVAGGNQFKNDPFGESGATSWGAIAQKRTNAMSSSALTDDGRLDFNSPKAKETFGHLQYNPSVLANTTPELAKHIAGTKAFLESPTGKSQAQGVLNGITAPNRKAATGLVGSALGKGPTEEITDQDTKVAVLSAMFRPMDQGSVGSCFATAPTRRMRETSPIDAMKAYSEIAQTGFCKPKGGPKVPAVTKIPAGDNPLVRSWEYSVATSAARQANAGQVTKFTENMNNGIDLMENKFDAKDWNKTKQTLRTKIAGEFNFVYDSSLEAGDANDGSSSMGRYVIVRKKGNEEITEKDAFITALTETALDALKLKAPDPKVQEITDLVKSTPFIDAICPGKYQPWKMESGGYTDEATKTLYGGNIQRQSFIGAAPTTGKPPEGDRTKAVLSNFLGAFGGTTDPMVTVNTAGQHGFNAMPNHPSLDGLKGANATERNQKIDQNLVQPGVRLRDTDVAADRTVFLFDDEMKTRIKNETNSELKALLETAAKDHRPDGKTAAKPAAIAQKVKTALGPYNTRKAEIETDKWEQDEIGKGRAPVGTAKSDKLAKNKKDNAEGAENSLRGKLASELGAPEFVIADTNWGGSLDHTFFVVAPDPTTGEPIMWKKTEPPGSLYPAGRDWVDRQWEVVK